MSAEASEPTGPRSGDKAQRLRIRFARGAEAAEIGHLDLTRCWERAFTAAGLSVSYSGASRRQPRITIAAGLPLGVTGAAEVLDVVLARRADPAAVRERVQPHLPPGISIGDVREVGLGLPSLPSAVRWADYEVDVPSDDGRAVGEAIAELLSSTTIPWVDTRGEKVREYDLRPLVQDLRVEVVGEGTVRLAMRLRCDASGVGRPDQVVKALGLPEAARVHRVRLVLAEASPAREAWRRKGRFVA